ncbi:MAG: replication-relaxation family protein, partial [Candidatus Methylomirabilis sp.]|nr:replication-relaxation family protein [Deltaproteobacteria bacterium]
MPTQANLFPAPALVRRAKGAKTRFTPEQLAAVLLTIHRERFMTSEQVQRTCYTSKSPAYRDLAWLESEGHLRQVVHRARGATTPRAYAVTTKGLGAILAVRPDLPATLADREDARARRGGLTP